MLLHLLEGAFSCIIPQNVSNLLCPFPISWYDEKLLLFLCLYQMCFDRVSFFSISLLEDNGDDHYIQLLQHNIQDYKQLQTFFRNFSLLKFLLYSKKAKIWFISLYNTEVSIRMHDHWSQCPDNNEEGKVSIVCPVDNDCPVFGKLQFFIPWIDMRKCLEALVYFEVI